MIAIVLNFPRLSISRKLSTPNTTVEIKLGDLFEENRHLVIGTNDTFDTELGEVIKPSSVQGQFLTRVYYSDINRLDKEIDNTLISLTSSRKQEYNKTKGKSWRYPIGTTVALGSPDRRYFLCAYGRMGNDLKVTTTTDNLWCSLSCLWDKVREKGHGLKVSIPVVGSDLARTNLSRMTLIRIIVLSFITASQKEFVAKKLTIVIYTRDIDTINLPVLETFLDSVCN